MGDKYNQSGKCESCGKSCTFNAKKCETCHRPDRKPQKKDVPDFDLPDVSGESVPAKPRVHRGPDDNTCVSCEG